MGDILSITEQRTINDRSEHHHGADARPRMPTRSTCPNALSQSEKTTRHTITLDGREWRYDATLGTITIDTAKVKPAASIFFAAFNAVDDQGATDPTRP